MIRLPMQPLRPRRCHVMFMLRALFRHARCLAQPPDATFKSAIYAMISQRCAARRADTRYAAATDKAVTQYIYAAFDAATIHYARCCRAVYRHIAMLRCRYFARLRHITENKRDRVYYDAYTVTDTTRCRVGALRPCCLPLRARYD